MSVPVREGFPLLVSGTAELMYLILLSFALLFLYGLYRRFQNAWATMR